MAKIHILVATTDKKIEENASFYQLPFQENFQAIVVNQQINENENLIIDSPFVEVLNVQEKGISNSRNLAITYATGDYVHFCDDDVQFLPNYLESIHAAIEKFPSFDFLQFQIQTPEGERYKNYPAKMHSFQGNTIWNRRKILFFSSIEIVAKLSTIKQNDLQFNSQFGVGSGGYPMGEEALFLLDALGKNASFVQIPKAIVVHPKESSGSRLGKKELETLGILFSKVYKGFAPLFSVYYAFKKRTLLKAQQISIKQAIKWMKVSIE